MSQERLVQPLAAPRWRPVAWSVVSLLLHALVLSPWLWRATSRAAEEPSPFQLPNLVEFGLADSANAPSPGGGDATREPPPQPAPPPKAAVRHARVRAARAPADPNAYALAAQAAAKTAPQKPAAVSGEGDDADGGGAGLGTGLGAGSGFAPAGATIALNVDMQRIRKTALMLETEALLDVIPEWQMLLAGSGIEPMRDLSRVFVASPTLERSSVVVAADHQLPRERVAAAASQLAAEQGKAARFHEQDGYPVATWYSRGPTERSIALTSSQQLTITRTSDLSRVLQVAASLTEIRKGQGVTHAELDKHGGLLAMEDREAVALWVEGARKYVRSASPAVPESVRLSLFPVDQFTCELSVRAQYPSPTAAAEALELLEAQRHELSDHPRVSFLGLKSAVDKAELTQQSSALRLRVKLTLHQTRYLMGYVTRALKPRAKS